jgi:hypothetical protein
LSLVRMFGARDGGSFEKVHVDVLLTRGERIQRLEVFEIDAADRALARFAELPANRE